MVKMGEREGKKSKGDWEKYKKRETQTDKYRERYRERCRKMEADSVNKMIKKYSYIINYKSFFS